MSTQRSSLGARLSRRTLFECLVGASLGARLGFSQTASNAQGSSPSPPAGGARRNENEVRKLVAGFRRTEVHHQRYRVTATVSVLGMSIFHRSGVGGGYAAAESGIDNGATGTALQFGAGSVPDRAAGLNRFGLFQESVVIRNSAGAGSTEVAFAGFITSNKEQSLGEARKALNANGAVTSVTLAWGGTSSSTTSGKAGPSGHTPSGRTWSRTQVFEVPAATSWAQNHNTLTELLRQTDSIPTGQSQPKLVESSAAQTPTFLTAVRNAALSREASFKSPFLHNSKVYELRTRWRNVQSGEMQGELFNDQGEKTAEFTNHYQPGDPSGLPIRIEYHARSYLRLTFEADPAAPAVIPSLFHQEPL